MQNVYPLYDDTIKRIGAQEDRLFGDQKEFVHYVLKSPRLPKGKRGPAPQAFGLL